MAYVTSHDCSRDLLCWAMPLPTQIPTLRAGQTKIWTQTGENANRKGIYPPLPGAEKIQYVHMELLDAKRSNIGKGVRKDFLSIAAFNNQVLSGLETHPLG
jgi:hypothetical protein